jgi:AAA+ ATPase superfamily predicted ATPase
MGQVIVGRKNEIAQIEQYYKSGKAEFIAVYGRRRVGKTFLIR